MSVYPTLYNGGEERSILVKKILYVLNDCMRKFSYERAAGLYRSLQKLDEPFNLYILRSDAYAGFSPEHNFGEYNIYRLPDYGDFDGIILDINSIFSVESKNMRYALQSAIASGKPVLSIANQTPGACYVGIDNRDAMMTVIRHLHAHHGLTDFWFALGPSDNYENQERINGLLDYCEANGLPCGDDRVYSESFIIESGIHAFNALLARHGGRIPQAVICANDHIAIGVCHAAKAAGYSVPGDFLVTGFDNTALSASFDPAITTVDQVCTSTGEACIDTLRRIWHGEAVPEVITTPTRLVLRQSTEKNAPIVREAVQTGVDFIGSSSSDTDFNYKMNVMQYRLPVCRTIEEICQALIDCISALNCGGLSLVLDSRLFDTDRILSFRDHMGQMRDISSDLWVEGYPDTLELVFQWEKGKEPQFPRQRIDDKLPLPRLKGSCANYLFAPLHFMEHAVGYLCVRDCLDLMRIKGVSMIVSTLSMALRSFFSVKSLSYINQVLSGVSMKDGLTGLYNRLGYHELAYPLYREAAERGQELAVVFLDMDRLKHINDVYGHGPGDQAIRCVAEAIRQSIPEAAIPVRYGGDEFLILIPEDGRTDVSLLVETIEAAIQPTADAMDLPETPGVSAGFVIARPASGKTLEAYVQEADALMYREKKTKKARRPV